MNVRRTILLVAAGLLASRAGAQGTGGSNQQPPADKQTWYQQGEEKAKELGQEGEDAAKKGASSAKKSLSEADQAATDKVTGTKTVTGRIADVSKDQVTVKGSDGSPLNLKMTPSTQVTVGGQKGSAGSLQQGEEVRASYTESGGSATAKRIDVKPTSP